MQVIPQYDKYAGLSQGLMNAIHGYQMEKEKQKKELGQQVALKLGLRAQVSPDNLAEYDQSLFGDMRKLGYDVPQSLTLQQPSGLRGAGAQFSKAYLTAQGYSPEEIAEIQGIHYGLAPKAGNTNPNFKPLYDENGQLTGYQDLKNPTSIVQTPTGFTGNNPLQNQNLEARTESTEAGTDLKLQTKEQKQAEFGIKLETAKARLQQIVTNTGLTKEKLAAAQDPMAKAIKRAAGWFKAADSSSKAFDLEQSARYIQKGQDELDNAYVEAGIEPQATAKNKTAKTQTYFEKEMERRTNERNGVPSSTRGPVTGTDAPTPELDPYWNNLTTEEQMHIARALDKDPNNLAEILRRLK